jgi:bifunctional NMN adenylyltransferase/nudix hydrolase
VIIYLGLAPILSTLNNPLPYEARKQMIQEQFPDVDIHYIKDHPSDEAWSKNLDSMIGDVITPNQTVLLYGGRDSFLPHYDGRFPTTELEQNVYMSGTQLRRDVIHAATRPSSDFRRGVIWATSNRYANPLPTVDCALFLEGPNQEPFTKLVLGHKTTDPKDTYRFIGGFVDAKKGNLEANCRREVGEEAGVDITEPVYITSAEIEDWRYRGERQGVLTSFFHAHLLSGRLEAADDIESLGVFPTKDLMHIKIVPEHEVLRDELRKYLTRNDYATIYLMAGANDQEKDMMI